MKKAKKIFSFLDLFAGAGGLSEGFIRAGYEPVAHVEYDTNACLTLKTRMAYYYLKDNKQEEVYYAYLKKEITREDFYVHIPSEIINSVINEKISEQNLNRIYTQIDAVLTLKEIKEIDFIIGGPPCQAFSLVGRKRNEAKKKTDERIGLYKLYIKFLKKYKPKVFVFENVLGIKSFEGGKLFPVIKTELAKAGYKIEDIVLNASKFGVLQNRKRVFILGYRDDINMRLGEIHEVKHNYKVFDILNDLPEAQIFPEDGIVHYIKKASEYLEKFDIRNGLDFTTQHITRKNNDNDKEIYRIARKLWHDKKIRLNYTDLPEKLINHHNTKAFLDRFKVVADDLPSAHTLVAHISKDGHYYIHPFSKEIRSLTVREAARIQSFPDNYFFEGSRTSAFTQIGNAVPPLMAMKIAETLKVK